MNEVVIACDFPLVIGAVERGQVTDANLDLRDVAFRVLRQTDEDEYRQYAADNSTVDNPPFDGPRWFYAVAMD